MAGRGLIARVLALPAFLLLAAPGFALADDIRAHEERVFKNFAGGDYYALYDAIEAMLLRFPAAPESSLYFSDLVTLVDLYGFARVDGTLERVVTGLDTAKPPHANLYRLSITLERERLARRFAPGKAVEYVKRLQVGRAHV